MLIEDDQNEKNLTADQLRQCITLELYKETFLKSVDEAMGSKKPDAKEAAIQSLTQLLEDNADVDGVGICDFGVHFCGDGKPNRDKLAAMLKSKASIKKKAAAKAVKFTFAKLEEIAIKQLYQQWLDQLDVAEINSARDHVEEYHLKEVSKPREQAIYSFFHGLRSLP